MTPRYSLFALLLVTALLRGGMLWVMRENLDEDRDAYREIAENLATYRVFGLGNEGQPRPTAYRPPLYPVLLAKLAGEGLAVTPLRVAILHWLLGMGTVGLTWVVAGKMRDRGQKREVWLPVVTSLLVACDPILLHWSTFVMTETLATFLAVLALYTLVRFHFDRRPLNAAFAGCALGLAVLCRPTFLPWAGLCGLGLLFLQASGGRQPSDTKAASKEALIIQYARCFANLAAFGLVAAIVVSLWGYRNYQQFGKPIITTTHGGYTLYLANNEYFYHHQWNDRSGMPWNPSEKILLPSDDYDNDPSSFENVEWMLKWDAYGYNSKNWKRPYELVIDDVLYDAAIGDLSSNPLMFAYSCLYRISQLWSPLPHKLMADESGSRALLRYATCVWYLGVFAAAIAGIWQLKGKLLRSPWIWGVLLCLVFTGVHTFYWSNMRMRAPLMPVVALVAAFGVSKAAKMTKSE